MIFPDHPPDTAPPTGAGAARRRGSMADERRYQEDEGAEIFEAASAPALARGDAAPTQGLTLAELQAIGREVGIAPERIAEAAASLARSQPPLPRRTELG